MSVGELIVVLRQLPQDMEVCIRDPKDADDYEFVEDARVIRFYGGYRCVCIL